MDVFPPEMFVIVSLASQNSPWKSQQHVQEAFQTAELRPRDVREYGGGVVDASTP